MAIFCGAVPTCSPVVRTVPLFPTFSTLAGFPEIDPELMTQAFPVASIAMPVGLERVGSATPLAPKGNAPAGVTFVMLPRIFVTHPLPAPSIAMKLEASRPPAV